MELTNALALLPTPKAGDGERGRDLPRTREDMKSRELATAVGPLLPTPTAIQHPAAEIRDPWKRIASKHQTELSDIVRTLGAATPPPSGAGSTSSDDPHQPPLFPA